MGMTYGNKKCQAPEMVAASLQKDSAFTLERGWWGQANRYTCPLGATPGRALVLMLKKDIDDLDMDTNNTWDLIVFDDRRRLTIPNLIFLRSFPVTPGFDDDPNTVHVCELADLRFWYWQTFTNASFNVRLAPDGGYIDSTTNSGTPWTWDEVGEQLWNATGWGTAWPGWPTVDQSTDPATPYDPHGTPEGWHFWQVPALQALQVVARRLGCSLRFNPFDSSLDLVQLGNQDDDFDAAQESFKKQIVWKEEINQPWNVVAPEKVRVIFRRVLAESTGNPFITQDKTFPDTDLTTNVHTGTLALVWDDLMSTGTNATDLSNRADERADDFARMVRYFNNEQLFYYRGVGNVTDLFLGPRCRSISWQDVGQGIKTVVECGAMEAIDWSNYLQGAGEIVTAAQCVGGDIQETMLTVWGPKPTRFS